MNKRKQRAAHPGYQRRDVTYYHTEPKDVSTYSAINWTNGEYRTCRSIDHACAFAFGLNKRNQNQNWLACVRGDGYFIVL